MTPVISCLGTNIHKNILLVGYFVFVSSYIFMPVSFLKQNNRKQRRESQVHGEWSDFRKPGLILAAGWKKATQQKKCAQGSLI